MASNFNLSTLGKAELVKLAMNDRKPGGPNSDNKPEYMKMTGSIFNAQTTQQSGRSFNWTEQRYGEQMPRR